MQLREELDELYSLPVTDQVNAYTRALLVSPLKLHVLPFFLKTGSLYIAPLSLKLLYRPGWFQSVCLCLTSAKRKGVGHLASGLFSQTPRVMYPQFRLRLSQTNWYRGQSEGG